MSSPTMTLWLFNVAWWRAVQLLSFQTLTGSIYFDISWTFPILDYQPAYLKLLQDSTLDSWLMLLKQTDYLLMPSSKQNHHSNQVQFHCDNLSNFDWLSTSRTTWQPQVGGFLQYFAVCYYKYVMFSMTWKSLPLWSTLVMLL